METLKVRQRSSSKLTQFTMISKVQGPLACNINVSLTELQCFSHSHEWGYSAERWCCFSRKTVRSRQNSFKDQTEFTILTMLLDPLVSYIKDYLTNCSFSPIYFYALILYKVDVAHPWKCWQLGSVPFKSKLSSPCLTRCKTLFLETLMLLLQELQCFSHSLEEFDWAERWCWSSRKTLRGMEYSFKQQTEFTILTMLLDPLVSNIKG
jgi:hypothetical protein